MTANLEWKYGRVNDTNIASTVYRESGVDDSSEILGHHSSTADVVEIRAICSYVSPITRFHLPEGE